MTYGRREEILSKDIITIEELSELLWGDTDHYQQASRLIRDIKRKTNSKRWNVRGQLHIQDYLDYYGLPSDRYKNPLPNTHAIGDNVC